MILESIRLVSFRAHQDTQFSFTPGVNLLYGANGVGKTNVLEATHFLCLAKSFLASRDQYALRKGEPFFEIEGSFQGEQRSAFKVRMAYAPDEGKKLFVNKAPLDRLADIVGQVPVVILSPADHALTAEGPDVRRKFLNNILSQAQPVYLDDLIKYRRILKQRNALLAQSRYSGGVSEPVMASWNAELARLGGSVIQRRQAFVTAFSGFLEEAYQRIEAVGEHPTLKYQTLGGVNEEMDEATIQAHFEERLAQSAQKEREQGRTLVGPHRDELIFRLNDFEVRRYASQGQHRTFALALKLAQFFYLKERLDETPLLLLDDVFGNLDPKRTEIFLELLQSDAVGQSIITAAQLTPFDQFVAFGASEHQALRILAGGQLA